jgi:RHS repeat-associated protein
MYGLRGVGTAGSGRRGAAGRRLRRLVAAGLAPVLAAGTTAVPVVFTLAAAAGVSAAVVATAATPAGATAKTALVLLQNGQTTAPETAIATAAGFTVTQVTPTTWRGMTTAQFQAFSALVIGDPSSGTTCSTLTPTTGTSGGDAIGTAWQAAVKGNVAVLGAAPALALGSGGGATSLVTDAVSWAGAGSTTGLYESLNCEFSTAAAASSVPLLAGVAAIPGALTVTGQGSACGAGNGAGTVNKLAAAQAAPFGGLSGAALAAAQWPSPACAVRETFGSWPANFTPVAYDASSSATGATDFTASDGVTGQPYVLLGAPVSAATAALVPTAGGEVPQATTAGGANAAAPGVRQATAGDPVDTENGDFSQSATDLSVPGFGPALDFSRSYDAARAQAQTQAGTPGPMGYGWTSSLSTSLTTSQPTPGDIYTLDGLATDTGNGGPATSAALNGPSGVTVSGGNVYIADLAGNRVEEVPGTSGTQWGISMTAGDMYTILGSDAGTPGDTGNGTTMAASRLFEPTSVTLDSAGNLYVADSQNNRVLEVPVTTGTQRNIPMTADDVYTIAGQAGGIDGSNGDGGPATAAFLFDPEQVIVDKTGANPALEISDSGNNRVQYLFESGGTAWGGQTFTANDIYTIAGSAAGDPGNSGDGSAATSALLDEQVGICLSSAGDLYIADWLNNQVREVPAANSSLWGPAMTKYDIYTIVGDAGGGGGTATNGTAAASALLDGPQQLGCAGSTNLYVSDGGNNDVKEVPSAATSAWGISMAADKVYTIAGSATGAFGSAGNGGAATAALLEGPGGVALDPSGNLDIVDGENNELRQVSASTFVISAIAGAGSFAQDGDGGPSTTAGLRQPASVAFDSAGDLLVSDLAGNRVQEIAARSHTQFGITMTAGDVYTVAGSAAGFQGDSGDGGAAIAALLNGPFAIAVDAAGNLYVSDTGNGRIRKVSASTGVITAFAGKDGAFGDAGNGGPATAATLSVTVGLAVDAAGNVYISDQVANQVREVAAVGGTQWGQSMTAGDIYLIAGSSTEAAGASGDGGPAVTSSTGDLREPAGLAVSPAGDIYIADEANNRIQEVAAHTGTQWRQSMTAAHIYTVIGNAAGASGSSGDGGPATAALLFGPQGVTLDPAGDLDIADTDNSEIREVAAGNGIQWSQAMTAGDIYTIAGTLGDLDETGDGGPALDGSIDEAESLAVDHYGNLYIPDTAGADLREVTATTFTPFPLAPQANAIDITQPDGSVVTFYPPSSGSCTAPYQAAGGFCTLPQNVGATLTFAAGGGGTYTYSPTPGSSYVYGSSGALQSETDAAGSTLTVSYGSPAPGSGTCPATAAACNTVTAASGRTLVIGLNAANLITSVTDPMDRTWTYAYNSVPDLTSVTDPMGHVTSYAYGAGSTGNATLASDLTAITAPNAQPGGPDAGDATVNVYNAFGEVTSQTDPAGFVTTFNYCASAATGNCLNPETGTGIVSVTTSDGTSTVDDYQQGTLAAQSDFTGTALTSETDAVPAASAGVPSGGTLLDTTTEDADGNITTETYDAAGNATSATTPDGVGSQTATATNWSTSLDAASCSSTAQATSTCSSAQAGPSPVAPGGVITPPSTAPPLGVSFALYDTEGNQLYVTTGVYEPGASSAAYSQTTYALFRGNSVTLSGTTISCATPPPAQSLPCATINADGVVTQLSYDFAGDLASVSMPDGNGTQVSTATYSYDAGGELTSATSPDGNLAGANAGNYTTTTAYNADGQKASVTQAGGSGATATPRVINYGYDASSNQTTVEDARGFTTITAYDADDRPTVITDPLGNATLTCYDAVGQVTQTVPPVGVAANSLTPASCPTAYPAGYGTRLAPDASTHTFNAAGYQTAMTTPAPAGQTGSETSTYTYDANGNLLTTTAPPASGSTVQVTTDTYNSVGKIASVTVGSGTPAASTTSYCYDPNGDTTAVVAPDGNLSGIAPCETSAPYAVSSGSNPTQASYQTTSSYDSADELVLTTSPATAAAPSGASTAYTYDPEGNRLTATDPNGVAMTWTYTPDDQPVSLTYSGSTAHSVAYAYDAEDDLTSMTDATGSAHYTYDVFSELMSATNGAGQTVSYSYSADGDITTLTYPLPTSAVWATSDTVTYAYDKSDRLDSVADFNGQQIAISDTPDGQPSMEMLGSTGDTISTSYNAADTPSAITLASSTATLLSFAYADAPAGNITSETDTPAVSQSSAAYTYDAQGRIASMTPGTSPALSYGFDASGNLTTLPTGAAGTYDKSGELTSSALGGTTASYAYNADGERLTARQGSSTIASGTWNGATELTAYDTGSASMSAATYQGNGLRATATTAPAGGSASTQAFVWDTNSQLLMDSVSAYIYAGGTAPAEQVNLATGALSYLSTDALGSVRGIVGSAGTITGNTSYDAWGNPLTSGGLTSSTPFGYAGSYTDPTGLIYLISRYYDPSTGQFLSVDPDVSDTGDPYGYTAGDPVNETDPTGARPKGIGYAFLIGRTFTPGQAELFVLGLYFGYAVSNISFKTSRGTRFVDVYNLPGWINEVKTGVQYQDSSLKLQVAKDDILLNQGYGIHLKSKLRINGGTWWFFPSSITKLSGSNFYTKLFNDGLNVMLFIYRKGQSDKAYDNHNNWSYLTEAGNTHNRKVSVYKHIPADPVCPPQPEFVV